jgi:CRP-like cAMP-binding protein
MVEDGRHLAQAVLRQSAWLQRHGVDLVEPMVARGTIFSLRAGQWVHSEGDDNSGVVVVLSGALQALAQAHGEREILVSQLGAGAAIGQSMRFGGGPRLVTLVCAEDSLLLQATDRVLGQIATERPQIWQALAALLYAQMGELVQTLAEVAGLPPRQRLAARLLRLAGAAGGQRTLAIKQHALAEMVGLTRKTVNGFLADFERQGLVRRAYGAVTLIDGAGLQRVAAS